LRLRQRSSKPERRAHARDGRFDVPHNQRNIQPDSFSSGSLRLHGALNATELSLQHADLRSRVDFFRQSSHGRNAEG